MRNTRDIIERLKEDVDKYERLCGAAAIMAPNAEAELEDAIEEIERLRVECTKAEGRIVCLANSNDELIKGSKADQRLMLKLQNERTAREKAEEQRDKLKAWIDALECPHAPGCATYKEFGVDCDCGLQEAIAAESGDDQ